MAMTNEEINEKIYGMNENPPMCNCCRKRVTRIIMPHTSFNESGNYLFHCKGSGTITPIKNIEWVITNNKQES